LADDLHDYREGSIISSIGFYTFNNTRENFPPSAGFARGRNPGSDFKKSTTLIDLAMTHANFGVDTANKSSIIECILGLRLNRDFAE
jgi:hypothetical protein